jgi:hypothetical protein
MQVFLVMRDEEMPAADSLFLRDGFSGAAFLFAPFWLAVHRLWLPALAYVLAAVGISHLHVGPAGLLCLFLALHAFFGLEGQAMRAADLGKRGYALTEIVAGDTLDDAELRYFAAPPPAQPRRAPPPSPWSAPQQGGQP